MKKISVNELKSMLESDKKLSDKLNEYLNGETDVNVIGEKTIEFMRQEGYEIDEHNIELSADDLENVSGGISEGVTTGLAVIGTSVAFALVALT